MRQEWVLRNLDSSYRLSGARDGLASGPVLPEKYSGGGIGRAIAARRVNEQRCPAVVGPGLSLVSGNAFPKEQNTGHASDIVGRIRGTPETHRHGLSAGRELQERSRTGRGFSAAAVR
jgi:hypothetical protein